MRRSIRFKLSMFFLVMFLLFVATLLLSFIIFFRNDFRYDVVKEEQYYQNMVSKLADKASASKDEKSIETLLAPYANDRMQIQLLNKEGKVLWSLGHSPTIIDISAKDYIITGGVVRYGLRINGMNLTRTEVFEEYAIKYLWIILLLFTFLFLLIAFFLHLSITKPVLALYRRMENDPLKMKISTKDYRRDEIGVLEKKFDQMINRLQTVDRQQQTMLAAISHDLKTPLTSIIIYTERLSSGKVSDRKKQQHYYEVIGRKADDIKDLIDKFQDAALFSNLDVRADFQSVSAAEFFQSVFDPYTEEWDDVDAKLRYESIIDGAAMIRIDKSLIRRLMANVIGNAVKYGAQPLIVHVFLTQSDNYIKIKIENNGMQVPDDKIPLLFDRFYRAEPSRSREKGGSGLGLFICREIIEKHRGFIRAYKPWNNDFGIEIKLPIVNS
ncbi:sensor histidine kinase [Sporolactobacillus pectinivorans]|uniref:sensor histidine kinase n=1 Tax=Sporolactobacillus pectinivorans TaxID=1591408 RepID=UPI000C25C427|nr:HAMP domain-containing sensor histidine kinase [Sporolactobacillus pectinivorans]